MKVLYEEPVQQKRGYPNQNTGLIHVGVWKNGNKYSAKIKVDGTHVHSTGYMYYICMIYMNVFGTYLFLIF